MTSWRFILRSLLHHRRINLAVALGVMAATAVLTGALIVGDSVRGSLRDLTLDRLGKIDEVLVSDRFFRAELAAELTEQPAFKQHYSSAVPAILLPHGTAERKTAAGDAVRSSDVLVLACGDEFWDLGDAAVRPEKLPRGDGIVLNEPLARDLGITREDLPVTNFVIRFPKNQQIAGDLSVGQKDSTENLAELTVVDIVPAKSLGRFGLQPTQRPPRNAYIAIDHFQSELRLPGKANAVLIAGNSEVPPDEAASRELAQALQPTFEDFGFVIKHARLTFPEQRESDTTNNTQPEPDDSRDTIFDYYSFSTERLLLDDAAVTVARKAFTEQRPTPVLTYLANSIGKRPRENNKANPEDIRWSMVSAIDFDDSFAPVSAEKDNPIQPLGENEIVLNQWAADDLGAQIGDSIFVTYFDPETAHGETVARTVELKLVDIAKFTRREGEFGPGRPPPPFVARPTLVNDPDLTPFVPGLTDKESIEDWDLPFNTSDKRREDDEYYYKYFTTPKAFVSLATGRRLWDSRFGATTSLRISSDNITAEQLRTQFIEQARKDGASFGFDLIPVKRQGLEASKGATPFDGLFLALSFFIIAAALMLVSLLFRLGIDQRAAEVGILLAVGLRRRLTGRMLAFEGLLVSALGAVLGVGLGIGYAWLMIYGLNHWWQGAVGSSFLEFDFTVRSLAIGYFSGVAVCVLTIWWSIFRTRKVPVRRLLAGQTSGSRVLTRRKLGPIQISAAVLVCVAIGVAGYATQLGGEAQAGAFVGSGFVLLIAMLLLIWTSFRGGQGKSSAGLTLAKLAARNAGRNPARSTITIGLMAFASFLIVAMSSFRMSPTDAGIGGFDLIAESSRPIFTDLNTLTARDFNKPADSFNVGTTLALRLKPGQDASCNNLYQATQPRVLGVPPAMIQHFDDPQVQHFSWGGSAAQTEEEKSNPWRVLDSRAAENDEPVPVVIDKNTAMYSLKLVKGIGEEFTITYDDGMPIRFRVAGLLANSVLQGSLLIGENDFERLFPSISGYRFFLVAPPAGESEAVAEALEEKFSVEGLDASSARDQLAALLAVQNTYLSTFQSLGALGLLLGTIGLATVQLRSILERRQELALLRAAGFRRRRLAEMVMLENIVLLIGGLLTGIIAALLAVLPHVFFGAASVPWSGLAMMLSTVFVVGLIAGFATVRATLRAPLLAALRGD